MNRLKMVLVNIWPSYIPPGVRCLTKYKKYVPFVKDDPKEVCVCKLDKKGFGTGCLVCLG